MRSIAVATIATCAALVLPLVGCGGSGLSDSDRSSFATASRANNKAINDAPDWQSVCDEYQDSGTLCDFEDYPNPAERPWAEWFVLLRGLIEKADGDCKSRLEALVPIYRYWLIASEGVGDTKVPNPESVPPESAGVLPDLTTYSAEPSEKDASAYEAARTEAADACGFENFDPKKEDQVL